uniref:NADH dehydrogenase subunit 3 n=1 Tax=Echinocrepis rostrata TaxID=527038 RepID=UPI00292A3CB0|nr:NADH dehydrogenase subunit 3 [Echinocrepis rostrata]WNL54532.1 NADH dehydrogenase subunit 3 [Echinocrepis rostrata]
MTSLSFLIISTIIIVIILALAAHILPSRNANNNKNSPYECGFDPLNSARLPFSFRFFLIAILFLLFDLEIALLFPLPAANMPSEPQIIITTTTLFMGILTLGLVFEWINGGLEWAE